MRVIQMLTTVTYGDAVGNDVLALDSTLKKAGYKTCIYAENIGNRVPPDLARPITKLPRLKKKDIIIYHLAVGTDLNYKLPDYPGRKIVVYHNITPSKFFYGYSLLHYNACRDGIEGAEFLADKVEYCLADSEYNKQNMEEMGYSCPIEVLPILIPFDDYKMRPNHQIVEKYTDDGYINILFTGRIAPNKCQEDVIAAFYQYHKKYNEKSRLILVGNYSGMEPYYDRLRDYVKSLGIEEQVIFTGHISFDEILAYYRIADLFLCMSEHEGFCVPLVEAMFFDIPIVAFDSSAIGYTLGGSGFLLKDKNPLETAGVINYIIEHSDIKENLLAGQRERLKDFDHDIIESQFLLYLKKFIEAGQ